MKKITFVSGLAAVLGFAASFNTQAGCQVAMPEVLKNSAKLSELTLRGSMTIISGSVNNGVSVDQLESAISTYNDAATDCPQSPFLILGRH